MLDRAPFKRIVDGNIVWAPHSKAPSSSPPAAATSNSTSARMFPSATSPTPTTAVRLYLQETFTFRVLTSEASVVPIPLPKVVLTPAFLVTLVST